MHQEQNHSITILTLWMDRLALDFQICTLFLMKKSVRGYISVCIYINVKIKNQYLLIYDILILKKIWIIFSKTGQVILSHQHASNKLQNFKPSIWKKNIANSFTLYIRTQRRYHRISRRTKIWNNAFLFSWDFNKGILCRFVLLNCDTKSVKSCTARMYEHQLQNLNWGQSICQISFT